MNQTEQFVAGNFVEILTVPTFGGTRNRQGTVVGPSVEAGKTVVEHYPGIGSAHYRHEDLKRIDRLRKVNWTHSFSR